MILEELNVTNVALIAKLLSREKSDILIDLLEEFLAPNSLSLESITNCRVQKMTKHDLSDHCINKQPIISSVDTFDFSGVFFLYLLRTR